MKTTTVANPAFKKNVVLALDASDAMLIRDELVKKASILRRAARDAHLVQTSYNADELDERADELDKIVQQINDRLY